MDSKIFWLIALALLVGVVAYNNNKTDQGFADLDGYKIHYKVMGQGLPTVIFEAGAGGDASVWEKVAPEIAKSNQAFTYDRAGMGRSQYNGKDRQAQEIVSELDALLQKLKINPPYILVGHSIGGIYMRYYQNQHPGNVVGMVLIDPGHELMAQATGNNFVNELKKQVTAQTANLSQGAKSEALGAFQTWEEMSSVDMSDVGNIPVTVIASDKTLDLIDNPELNTEANENLRELQKEIARQSSQGKYIVATSSGHMIQLDQPQIVIDAIKEMIKRVK